MLQASSCLLQCFEEIIKSTFSTLIPSFVVRPFDIKPTVQIAHASNKFAITDNLRGQALVLQRTANEHMPPLLISSGMPSTSIQKTTDASIFIDIPSQTTVTVTGDTD